MQTGGNGDAGTNHSACGAVQATYTFSLPYVYTVQTGGLCFPVHMWFDGENQKLRMDVFDGIDSTITEKVHTFSHSTVLTGRSCGCLAHADATPYLL